MGAGLVGWLAPTIDGVEFIQWTRTADSVTGTFTDAYVPLASPTSLQHQSASFTGVISGESVTLAFSEGLGVSRTWSGALRGDSLVLSYPAADGSLATAAFSSATVADYNTAVTDLQGRVGKAQSDAASAAAQAAAQAALDRAINDAIYNLGVTVNQMNGDADRATSFAQEMTDPASSSVGALANNRAALGQVRQDAGTSPMDDYQRGVVCSDVGAVESQVGGVTYYTDQVRNYGGLELDNANSVASDIGGVHSAITALQSAASADPAGPPSSISIAQANAAISAAQSIVQSANSTAQKALTTAKTSDATAAALLVQAGQIATSVGASC